MYILGVRIQDGGLAAQLYLRVDVHGDTSKVHECPEECTLAWAADFSRYCKVL
jgi:hypothetical protein